MFFHDLLLGLWVAFILVAPITLITLIGSKNVEMALLAGAGMTVVYGIVNWLTFWGNIPPVGFTKIAIYHEYWLLFWALVLAAIAVGAAATDWEGSESPSIGSGIVAVLLVGLLIYGITQQFVWSDHRAKTLAHEVHGVNEKAQLYPNTDANHILQVPEETADFLANQVLASSSDRKLATIYDIGSGTLQSVDNHLYWIYGLDPTGWRNSNKVPNGEVPGFVVVDAENPNTHPLLRLKDANGEGYHIRYYSGGYHWHKLERLLWSHGYRDQLVTGLTLEVDDSWRPYYTASIDKVTAGLHRDVPSKALVIDPQTGKIRQYSIGSTLAKHQKVTLPPWVDRVYTREVVTKMLNWWGEWDQAKWSLNESSANRYKVAGKPVLVYTKGGHPVWQAIMTSYSRDTSAAYLVLFDARDNEARFYTISGLTLPSVAEHTILGSGKNVKNLQPVHLTLHKIYGHLTWVAPLIRPTEGSKSSAQQGVALLPYDETNGDNVVMATSMSAALTQYRVNLANGGNNSGPEENANKKSAEGTVKNLSKVVESGQTVIYFTLGNDTINVYRATLQPSGSNIQNLELPFIKTGAKIRLTYLDTGGARRDVGAYDDLGLQVASNG